MSDIIVPSDRYRSIILALCLEAGIANEGVALVNGEGLGVADRGSNDTRGP